MDIWSKKKRSEVMSRIRGKNTKPELLLRSYLFKKGFRFRIHKSDLPGKPDIVLPKYNTAIFVHGCFWHYHKDCQEGRIPSTREDYWKAKLLKTVERDVKHQDKIKEMGWKVLVVWECELENEFQETVSKVISILNSNIKDSKSSKK